MASPPPPMPPPLAGCDPTLMPLPTVRIVFVFAVGIYFPCRNHSTSRGAPGLAPSPTSPSPPPPAAAAEIPLQRLREQHPPQLAATASPADPPKGPPIRPSAVIQFPQQPHQGQMAAPRPQQSRHPNSPATEPPNPLADPSIQTRRRLRPISEMHSRTFYFLAKTIMALSFTLNAITNLIITFPSTVRLNHCQTHVQLMQFTFQLGYAMAMGIMLARADHILGISKWSTSHRPIHVLSWLIYVGFGIADVFTFTSVSVKTHIVDEGPYCSWEPSPILYMSKRVFDLCIEMYVCFVCFNALWVRRERAEFNTTRHFIQALAVSYVPRACVLIVIVLFDIYVTAAGVFTPTLSPFFWIACNALIMVFVAYDDFMFKVVMGRAQRKRQRMRGGKWAKNAAAAAVAGGGGYGGPNPDGGSFEPTELVVHTDQLTRPVGTLDDTAPDRYTAAAYGGGIRYSAWGRNTRDRDRANAGTQSSGSAETVITEAAMSPEMLASPTALTKAAEGMPLRLALPTPSATATAVAFTVATSPTSPYPHSTPSPQHAAVLRTSFMGMDTTLGNNSPSLHSFRHFSNPGSGISSVSGSGSGSANGGSSTNSNQHAHGSSPTASARGLLLASGVSSFASGSVTIATPGIASSPHGSLVWDEQRSVAVLDTLEGSPLSEARRLVGGGGSGLASPTTPMGQSGLGAELARRDDGDR
ncbi:hypothetical protein BCR44DRAFT_1428310 [Catenaria anguillulae PL171]|uniref:Uncharacterized protein n=1 Tax=Catenaria anguillulae PL171 TaxID=765915 RepID=A0A1Y2HVC3_9FUNG|nr:hypothetical protein BCR44DRAFT_1428310 [Catenaria anguillulae PL171]